MTVPGEYLESQAAVCKRKGEGVCNSQHLLLIDLYLWELVDAPEHSSVATDAVQSSLCSL